MKWLSAVLMLPVLAFAEVSFQDEASIKKVEQELIITNKHLEKINKALNKLNNTMDMIFKMAKPKSYDMDGNIKEDDIDFWGNPLEMK